MIEDRVKRVAEAIKKVDVPDCSGTRPHNNVLARAAMAAILSDSIISGLIANRINVCLYSASWEDEFGRKDFAAQYQAEVALLKDLQGEKA